MYFLYKSGERVKRRHKDSSELFFCSLTLILKYKYHYASSFSIFWKPKHKHMLIISVSIKSHAHRHTCTRTDGCYEYQLSWPPSIFSSVLDSLRSYATQNVRLPYYISLMPCVCLWVILSSSINAGPVSVGGLISLETSEYSLFFGRDLFLRRWRGEPRHVVLWDS